MVRNVTPSDIQITGHAFLPEAWEAELRLSPSEVDDLHDLADSLYDPARPVTCPARSALFRAFVLTEPENVRVVIVGQDPYPSPCHADGLAFSAPDRILTPTSLAAVWDALEHDLGSDFVRPDEYSPDLSKWAGEGVLLLNTALTVQNGKAGSHLNEWSDFTERVIRHLGRRPDTAFLLWGDKAKAKAKSAGINVHRPGVFLAAHPRAASAATPLLSAKHFSRCNSYLSDLGKGEVDWNLL